MCKVEGKFTGYGRKVEPDFSIEGVFSNGRVNGRGKKETFGVEFYEGEMKDDFY